MQYVILIYESKEDLNKRNDPKLYAENNSAYAAYTKALIEAGVMRGGEALAGPEMGTVVTLQGGKKQVHDGPYADTKEQLGGFYVIETANLDVALQWAARCPATATGKVEVRPTISSPKT
ncbi:MAG: YciI family protein [Bdellovibrionales bacterium]|nr:YciI family protein [Bdellovibrionales bacterium]